MWPSMCEQYARQAGVAGELEKQQQAPGCGTCGNGATPSQAVYRVRSDDVRRVTV
jgi:hypothetical protein